GSTRSPRSRASRRRSARSSQAAVAPFDRRRRRELGAAVVVALVLLLLERRRVGAILRVEELPGLLEPELLEALHAPVLLGDHGPARRRWWRLLVLLRIERIELTGVAVRRLERLVREQVLRRRRRIGTPGRIAVVDRVVEAVRVDIGIAGIEQPRI